MTLELPRREHNKKLAQEWVKAHPPSPEIPAVQQQLPATIVDGLFPFGYNPSIVRFGDRVLVAYRWHEKPTWETSLAIAELDRSGKVIANKKISLTGLSAEDPRLFTDGGTLWMSYVQATSWPKGGTPTCLIRYGRLIERDEWSVEGQTLVKYGRNDGMSMEKNWVPFFHRKNIHFIYSCNRSQTVIEVENDSVITELFGAGASWKWGECRGGTPPLPHQGKWLRFFHSRTSNRYYVGALLMEPEPPFNVISVSKRPVLKGSDEDSLTDAQRKACPFRHPKVAFPLGAIAMKEGWLLSVGINHGQCGLVTVGEGNFNF